MYVSLGVLLPLCGLVVLVCWWCVACGIAPCGVACWWCGVLVSMYVCVPEGLLPLWFGGVGVGGVMPGAMHPCGLVVVWCWIWLIITIHKY